MALCRSKSQILDLVKSSVMVRLNQEIEVEVVAEAVETD